MWGQSSGILTVGLLACGQVAPHGHHPTALLLAAAHGALARVSRDPWGWAKEARVEPSSECSGPCTTLHFLSCLLLSSRISTPNLDTTGNRATAKIGSTVAYLAAHTQQTHGVYAAGTLHSHTPAE